MDIVRAQSLRRVATTCAIAGVACTSPPAVAPSPVVKSVTWGFTAPWDPRSDSSVAANGGRLDAVVTGWIQLDSITGAPRALYPDRVAVPPGTSRFVLVSTYSGGRFRPEIARRLASASLADDASELGEIVAAGRYAGVVFDLEDQAPADTSAVLDVIRVLGQAARARGAGTIAVAVPAGDTAAYPSRAFAKVADLLVVMLYDEHWSTSAPGPIASPDWVRRTLARRVADIGPDRLVAALPLYAYRWTLNAPADALSYDAAQRAAADAGVGMARDPVSRSLHASLPGQWNLWVSDAELLRTLRAQVTALGVSRFALWRLGQEDPAIWSVVGR